MRYLAFKYCFKESVKILQLFFLLEQSLMGLGGKGSLVTEAGKQIPGTWLAKHSLLLELTQLRSPQKREVCLRQDEEKII